MGIRKLATTKGPRKKLIKELDALWSNCVRKNWDNKCAWPGCKETTRLSPHHYFHKAQGNFARWSLANGVLLCFGHHIRQVHQSGNIEPIREVLIQKIGVDAFHTLKTDSRTVLKLSIEQLKGLKSFLEVY